METLAAIRRIRRRVGFVPLFLLYACYSPSLPAGHPCADDSRCPSGQKCIAGFCGGSNTPVDVQAVDTPTKPIDAGPDAPPVACNVPEDCPNTNTCVTMACTNNECIPTTLADGASCGANAADRCCGGTCVNIASDEQNCGGCGLACAVGRTCEGVGATTQCGIKPAATSGRCTCAGATSECPDQQICRTVTPYANRCSPSVVNDCAAGEVLVDVSSCPNFCKYP